ncbi:MAG TPA: AMP-binding protein, partial [Polyangiaceae bacterium]|nr:AMP-binding protein [Polyangiaceae bacterium]
MGSLFRARVRQFPDRVAIEGSPVPGSPVPSSPVPTRPGDAASAGRRLTYRELELRVSRLAGALAARGVGRQDRIALLSENRPEYLEVMLAASRLGASVACQNWRLTAPELAHCITLVTPRVLITSPRFAERVAGLPVLERLQLGEDYEAQLGAAAPFEADDAAEPEDALLIL